MVVGRGRGLLRGEPMEVFKEGIWLVLNSWWEIRCFLRREIEIGGNPDPKVVQLRYYLFHWFLQSTVPPSVPSTTIKLKELLSSFEIDLFTYFDNSLEEVSEQLVVMYRECLKGDFSSVEIIQEANLSLARRVIGTEPVPDVPMGVFRQGIHFLMNNLLLYPLFIHHLCQEENMLQQLSDYIFFWFTQTIKPLSFPYLERIVRNELYSLPIHHHLAIDASITQLVASQLMLMHEECLQDNFSSVEILRENSLYQDDKGVSEIIGVAPPPVPPVERECNYSKKIREEEEEIRVWRQKDREKHRLLDDKDVAMGKKIKITSFIDRDISEELALVLPSTNQGSNVMYTKRLFNQDKGMSKKDVYKGGFTEASERAPLRDRQVQFESEEADSFGLDQFLTKVKKGKKALENAGGGGTMRAIAGSSMQDSSSDGGRGRTHIGFETGCSADQC